MINLQNAMLVALGFLLACLIAFLVVPAYRRRLERIATDRMRRALPLSEAEIRADKDKVRAESAVRVFTLERQVEQAKLASARQLIELSRRDARINQIENEAVQLRASLEEAQNARAVLEQTITERLPKVEHRLAEAKKLLYQRDREIATLTSEAGKSARALEDAFQINNQSRAEIERLSTTLSARSAAGSSSQAVADATAELRAQAETMRERIADQAALIAKLRQPDSSDNAANTTTVGYSTDDATVDALRHDLAAAQQALLEARAAASTVQADQKSANDQHLLSLKAKLQDQASEIARLKAAVSAYEDSEDEQATSALMDSKIGLKARVGALQAQVDSQTETIQRLRTEVASANEKHAKQAAQFVGEMRKIGSGIQPAPTQARKTANGRDRRPLAERLVEPLSESPLRTPTLVADAANDAPPIGDGRKAAATGTGEPAATESPPKERLMDRITNLAKA